ncbi:MAG: hypothetical protein ACLRWP_10680 [Bilophila wadsworthia]
MPSLTEVRDAAVATLKTALPGTRIDRVSGGAEAAAVMKKSLGTATVLVTALGAQNAADPRSLDFDVYGQFAALVTIYGRKDQLAREKDGLAIVERVAQALHGGTFGLFDIGPARYRPSVHLAKIWKTTGVGMGRHMGAVSDAHAASGEYR